MSVPTDIRFPPYPMDRQSALSFGSPSLPNDDDFPPPPLAPPPPPFVDRHLKSHDLTYPSCPALTNTDAPHVDDDDDDGMNSIPDIGQPPWASMILSTTVPTRAS